MTYAIIGGMASPIGGRLSAALRATYEAAGVSQEQIAAALGVDQPTVSRWARGMRRPPIDVLPDIERLCKVRKGTILRRAGYVEDNGDVTAAILADERLPETTRQVLVDAYHSALRRSGTPANLD